MADYDIYDLIMGQPPQAKASATALANAIRGGQGGQTLYALGAKDVPGALESVYGQQAKLDKEMLMKGMESHARYGAEQQALKQSLEAMRQAGADRRAALKLQEDQFNKNDKIMKEWGALSQKYHGGIQSGRNPLGLNENLLNRAGRLTALVASGEDPDVVVTSQLVRDLEMGIAALGGSSTGQMAKSAVDEVANRTLKRSWQEAVQWAFNNPQDAGAKEFVKQAMLTIGREHRAITNQQRGIVAQGLMSRGDLLTNPAVTPYAQNWMESSGMFSPEDVKSIIAGTWRPDATVDRATRQGRPPIRARIQELRDLGKDEADMAAILKSEGYED